MALKYTEAQLNNFDKATLVQLFLATQSQLEDIDAKLQLVLEQLAVSNKKRFGKSTEKLAPDNQIAFMEIDGKLVFFNEAEAVAAITGYDEDKETVKPGPKKDQRQTCRTCCGSSGSSGSSYDERRRTNGRVWPRWLVSVR